VVHAAFLDRATAVLPEEPEPVVALGIDETRRGKSRFVANPYTGVFEQIVDRWHTGFVDLAGDDDRDAVAPVLCSRASHDPASGDRYVLGLPGRCAGAFTERDAGGRPLSPRTTSQPDGELGAPQG
jgi:hypothetical protein